MSIPVPGCRSRAGHPEFIETPMLLWGFHNEQGWDQMVSLGRVGKPEEVALDELFFVTDAELVIGGGFITL